MTQKHTLQERLRQYSLLVLPVLATVKMADGQIIYHDVSPDLIYKDDVVGDNYTVPEYLDLDGNGTYDVEFAVWSSVASNNGPNQVNLAAVRQFGAAGNAMMGYTNLFSAPICSTPLPLYCASALNSGKEIGPGANFWAIPNTADLGTLVRSFINEPQPFNFLGQWNNLQDKYIGLRFSGGDGNTHYGWIRLDVTKSPAQIVIKDFAYESQHAVAIQSGDAGNVGIPVTVSTSPCSIYAADAVVNIVMNEEQNVDATVTISNLLGETIITAPVSSKLNRFDLSSFGKGIYLVTIRQNGGILSKKIFIR